MQCACHLMHQGSDKLPPGPKLLSYLLQRSGVVGHEMTSLAYSVMMASHTSRTRREMVLWATLKPYIKDL